MAYDYDPEHRSALLEQAAAGGEEQVAGLTLRPMTAATWSLFQRVKKAANVENDDWTFSTFAFVWLHSMPKDQVRGLYAKPAEAVAQIYEWMDGQEPAGALAFKPWMERQMEQFAASVTAATAGLPSEDESPKA